MSEKRTAVVLGASSPGGLGEAVARRLAGDGYRVAVAGRRIEPLQKLAANIGGTAHACDVTDEASIEALAAAVGPVHAAVNAAGTTDVGGIARIKRERIEAQFAIHVTGNLLFMKHFVAQMGAGSSFTLFSSLTARVPGTGLAAYAGAKAALDHIVRIAALEFGPRGIRVNAVAPGFSRTPMTEAFLSDDRIAAIYRNETALGGLVTPEQVASTVSWLASDDCFATGEIVHVSGGAQLLRLPTGAELKG
ncbi:SDR family NAD(P)-dependent oxidoreductase [Sphingomonas jaspsi]|uniref:SDR family NAD(P)-dependent oxidoreductase n=1 Tax=Sphingomonas jaspsi TaxID=392409 RepID=UPI0004B4A835|nr:SDR family oxidoreductase [Sphingomonas jaspsi]